MTNWSMLQSCYCLKSWKDLTINKNNNKYANTMLFPNDLCVIFQLYSCRKEEILHAYKYEYLLQHATKKNNTFI